MRNLAVLFALPASLLPVLLLSSVHCQQWPYDLPAHAKYHPEHERHIRRNLEIQHKLSICSPQGIRKMTDDEGEKFFMEYWQFDETTSNSYETLDDAHEDPISLRPSPDASILSSNISDHAQLLPPLLLHDDHQHPAYLPRIFDRDLFGRDYKCPTGTESCASIGQPNSCCATGETCMSLSGSGKATVGCCPSGATCGGDVGSCNTAEGYTSCLAGGCCISGYTCQASGCVYASTATVTTTLPAATVTSGVSWSTLSDSSTTETFVVSTGSQTDSVRTVTTTLVLTPSTNTVELTTVTQTVVIEPTSTTHTTVTTTTTSSTTCSSGFRACPASLGGGCCATDRGCGSDTCPALSTSTVTAVPPVLPTSGSNSDLSTTIVSTTTSVTSLASTVSDSGCPTGFYMCSAYYLGGCCRVGRDCDTTSCPTSASTTVVSDTGLTIVAPSGASSAVLTGTCANGWSTCAASDGGGCCPSGYSCGESCTAPASGQSNVGKGAPSSAVKARFGGWMLLILGIVSGGGMIFL